MKIGARFTMNALERWRLYLKLRRMRKSGLSFAEIQREMSDVWGTRQAAFRWFKEEEKFWEGVRRIESKS